MSKLWVVAKNTWNEYMEYRLNFVMWRLRNVLRLIVVYFLWLAIFSVRSEVFGYDQTKLLTYVLASSVVAGIVFSTKTQDIGGEINQGDLSNLLLKPMGVFNYWIARDIGDKLLNIGFSIIEVFLLVLILRPPLFFQTDLYILFFVLISLLFSIALYFLISILLSFFGFWTPDVWGPRFLFFIILEFFAGGLFPLDMLPALIYRILELSPFSYLLFFPIKIYLGQLGMFDIFKGLAISVFWIFLLYIIVKKVWLRGLTIYGAYGR